MNLIDGGESTLLGSNDVSDLSPQLALVFWLWLLWSKEGALIPRRWCRCSVPGRRVAIHAVLRRCPPRNDYDVLDRLKKLVERALALLTNSPKDNEPSLLRQGKLAKGQEHAQFIAQTIQRMHDDEAGIVLQAQGNQPISRTTAKRIG